MKTMFNIFFDNVLLMLFDAVYWLFCAIGKLGT